jgi:hypothetical protein
MPHALSIKHSYFKMTSTKIFHRPVYRSPTQQALLARDIFHKISDCFSMMKTLRKVSELHAKDNSLTGDG